MTEERIKKLVKKAVEEIGEDIFIDLDYVTNICTALAQTVAAESRKEGIEAMKNACLIKDEGSPSSPRRTIIRALNEYVKDTAERLKGW